MMVMLRLLLQEGRCDCRPARVGLEGPAQQRRDAVRRLGGGGHAVLVWWGLA